MTFYSEFIESKKDICIPSLQRDYVQGATKNLESGVIQSFLDELLSALRDERKINLNYIYGYYKSGSDKTNFVPVDGQQRLTTLWLLHLYIYASNNEDLPVRMVYESREYANDFTNALMDNLKAVLKNISAEDNIKEKIVESPWFIHSWIKDQTVESSLNTIREIHLRLKTTDLVPFLEYIKEENISFSFYEIDGVKPEIYIKMNGRGKPLSEFENLKSWIDSQLNKLQMEDSFQKSWRDNMDNKWTKFFWQNRNKAQENSWEIDDEQIRFFYILLFIYWSKKNGDGKKPIFEIKDEVRKTIGEELDVPKSTTLEKFVLDHIRQSSGYTFSLYILEKLCLIDEKFLRYFSDALNALCKYEAEIKACAERLDNLWYDKVDEKHSIIYRIFFPSEASEDVNEPTFATIANANAIISYLIKEHQDFQLFHWMKVMRNLIYNRTISAANISNILLETDRLVTFDDIYKVLPNEQENVKAFLPLQVKEEAAKAKKCQEEGWEDKLLKTERILFFKGAIRFLFTKAGGEMDDWENFDTKLAHVEEYFDINGLKKGYQVAAIRALVIRCSNWDEQLLEEEVFRTNGEAWREHLISTTYQAPIHDILLADSLADIAPIAEMDNPAVKKYIVPFLPLLPYSYILNEIPDSRFKWNGGKLAIYPRHARTAKKIIVFDWHDWNRRKMLLEMANHPEEFKIENRINNSEFFYGWDVYFDYKGHRFDWYTDDYIYALEGDEYIRYDGNKYLAEEIKVPDSVEKIKEVADYLIQRREEILLNSQQ